MLRSFSVHRYRNVEAHDLALARLNIFVGPNNAGKSTLIDAMGFFASLLLDGSTRSAFVEAIDRRGRGDLLDRGTKPPGEIEMKWVLGSKAAADLTYELAFRVGSSEDFPDAFYITREMLRYAEPSKGHEAPFRFIDCHAKTSGKGQFSVRDQKGKIKLHTMDVSANDTVFRQIKALLKDPQFYSDLYPGFERTADFVRGYFEGFHAYSSAEIDPRGVVAGVKRDLSVRALDRHGEQLVNVLRHVDQEPGGLDAYASRLRELMPELRRVKIVDVSDEQQQIVLEMEGGRRFKLKEMSAGTIKAMLLALLVSTPVPMTLLTIDEPELNLHPAWLARVAVWLRECRSAEQLIISTHSPDLLDRFTEAFRAEEAALFVFDAGGKGIRRVQPATLDGFFDEGWELGDLYRVGEPKLGGWPW
jgi:predicted ATPase